MLDVAIHPSTHLHANNTNSKNMVGTLIASAHICSWNIAISLLSCIINTVTGRHVQALNLLVYSKF